MKEFMVRIGYACWIFGAIISALSFLIMQHENGIMLYVALFFLIVHVFGFYVVYKNNNEIKKEKCFNDH